MKKLRVIFKLIKNYIIFKIIPFNFIGTVPSGASARINVASLRSPPNVSNRSSTFFELISNFNREYYTVHRQI